MDEEEKKDKSKKDESKEDEKLSPEEQKAEEEATKEVNEDELREKIAEDLGIDLEDDDQSELLDKLVKKEQSQREKLSGAIKQKITYREKFQKASDKPKDTPKEGETQTEGKPLTAEELEKRLDERDAKKDLEGLNLPEEIEKEVKDLAEVKGISIREAAQLPYIVSIKEEADRKARVENASPKRSNKGSHVSNIDPSKPLNPDDFPPLDTKEGREAWNEAKAARAKLEAQQK